MNESYRAPMADALLTIERIVGFDQLLSLFESSDLDRNTCAEVITQAARFADEVLAPLSAIGDRHGVAVRGTEVELAPGYAEAYQQFVSGGWPALTCLGREGGLGFPDTIGAAVEEFWAGADLAFSTCPALGRGAVDAFRYHASVELQELFLPKIVSGEWAATMCLTEPQAGSDLSAVQTRAERDATGFRLFGRKIFITWGEHPLTDNIVHLVLARLADAPAGSRGLSLFVVPKILPGAEGKRNAVNVQSTEHKLGLHASPTCTLAFGDTEGAVGFLLGREHEGLACLFSMMNHMRLGVGIQGVAIAERAYQMARRYASERVQGRLPGARERVAIIEHLDVKRMLLLMRSLTVAGRGLMLYAAYQLDVSRHGGSEELSAHALARAGLLTPVVKAWCTEFAQEVAGLAVQIHGGAGFVEETGIAQCLRDIRIATIYEGTNGIQAQDLLERKVMRDDGATLLEFVREIEAWAFSQAGALDDSVREGLVRSLALLTKAVTDVHRHSGSGTTEHGGIAWDFLMLVGYALGMWVHARRSIPDASSLSAGNSGSNPLELARVYAERVVPRAAMHAEIVARGSQAVVAAGNSLSS
jgi:3-(methylthio)propanoyl-CoA dehydrogenase